MMAVARRVIRPLHNMRDAMLKVAAGDLHVDTGYAERQDEIGALAGALETFKQQAADKVRIEAQERERNAGATARQQAIETYVGEFENMVRQSLRPARRRFRPDADHLVRPVDDLAPDQRARPGRREGLQRGLDERRDASPRLPSSSAPRSTTSASRRRTPPASPAARSARRATPTAPCRGSPNRRAGSAKSSA